MIWTRNRHRRIQSELVESLSLYGKQSKMDPDVIEPTFVGLINAFRFNEPEASGCSLLLSIGAKSTDIVFFDVASSTQEMCL